MALWSIIVTLMVALNAAQAFEFCPQQSCCIAKDNCKPGNITFDPQTAKNYLKESGYKFICGLTKNTETYVCCNDAPKSLLQYCTTAKKRNQNYFQPDDKTQLRECPEETHCLPVDSCPTGGISYAKKLFQDAVHYTCEDDGAYRCCSLLHMVLYYKDKVGIKNSVPLYQGQESSEDFRSGVSLGKFAVVHNEGSNVEVKKERLLRSSPNLNSRSTFKTAADWPCGRTIYETQKLGRIFTNYDAENAKEGDNPWQVGILSSRLEYICSGVVVGEKVILTVAHCVSGKRADSILVRIGDIDLQNDNEHYAVYDVAVSNIIVHPDYNFEKLEADIAILQLEHSLRGQPNIRPACLPSDQRVPDIYVCKVAGWGQIRQTKEAVEEFSFKLRVANFYLLERKTCQDYLRRVKDLGAFFKLQPATLCAKGYNNADTCNGDGGSGLVCLADDVYVLKGLVSWGIGCGFGIPGIYVDVSKYLDFINNYRKYIKPNYHPESSKKEYGQIYKGTEDRNYAPDSYDPDYNLPAKDKGREINTQEGSKIYTGDQSYDNVYHEDDRINDFSKEPHYDKIAIHISHDPHRDDSYKDYSKLDSEESYYHPTVPEVVDYSNDNSYEIYIPNEEYNYNENLKPHPGESYHHEAEPGGAEYYINEQHDFPDDKYESNENVKSYSVGSYEKDSDHYTDQENDYKPYNDAHFPDGEYHDENVEHYPDGPHYHETVPGLDKTHAADSYYSNFPDEKYNYDNVKQPTDGSYHYEKDKRYYSDNGYVDDTDDYFSDDKYGYDNVKLHPDETYYHDKNAGYYIDEANGDERYDYFPEDEYIYNEKVQYYPDDDSYYDDSEYHSYEDYFPVDKSKYDVKHHLDGSYHENAEYYPDEEHEEEFYDYYPDDKYNSETTDHYLDGAYYYEASPEDYYIEDSDYHEPYNAKYYYDDSYDPEYLKRESNIYSDDYHLNKPNKEQYGQGPNVDLFVKDPYHDGLKLEDHPVNPYLEEKDTKSYSHLKNEIPSYDKEHKLQNLKKIVNDPLYRPLGSSKEHFSNPSEQEHKVPKHHLRANIHIQDKSLLENLIKVPKRDDLKKA